MGQEHQPELPSSSPGLETPSIALALGPALCRSLGRWLFAEGPVDTEDSPALQPQAQHGSGYLSASRTRSLASTSSGCSGCDSLLLCLGQRHEKGGDLQPPPSCGTTMHSRGPRHAGERDWPRVTGIAPRPGDCYGHHERPDLLCRASASFRLCCGASLSPDSNSDESGNTACASSTFSLSELWAPTLPSPECNTQD
ncbi:hypothetical protein UY3_12790 [Chelonia mydas]|uniref:Uncharacterized protein n=1 Tax=Chelonia mydas TaxID=8469 RepID=M7B3M0_CHEMY|nr:hypothetical protein UY3_12790 [Chelonia mydas]